MRGGRGKVTGGCVGKREVAEFAFGAAEWEGIKKNMVLKEKFCQLKKKLYLCSLFRGCVVSVNMQ